MSEVSGLLCCLDFPVDCLQPVVQNRVVVSDGAQVTLEVLNVDNVESNDSRIQSNVQLGKLISKYERPSVSGNDFLESVQSAKDRHDVPVVIFL